MTLEQEILSALKNVRDVTIEVEDGERRHHLTDDELVVTVWKILDRSTNNS